jgi:hypothetical protein
LYHSTNSFAVWRGAHLANCSSLNKKSKLILIVLVWSDNFEVGGMVDTNRSFSNLLAHSTPKTFGTPQSQWMCLIASHQLLCHVEMVSLLTNPSLKKGKLVLDVLV